MTTAGASASRRRVLIAENEAIIALELEDGLLAEGFEVVGPFATCAAAERWVGDDGRIDAAILDYALGDGPCDQLARDLTRRGVPLILFSGGWPGVSPIDVSAVVIPKPAPFKALLAALHRVMASSDGVSGNGPNSRSYSASAIP